MLFHHHPIAVLKNDADVVSGVMLSVALGLSDCAQEYFLGFEPVKARAEQFRYIHPTSHPSPPVNVV